MSLPLTETIVKAFYEANVKLSELKPSYTKKDGVPLMRAGGPKGKYAIREDGEGKLVKIEDSFVLVGDKASVRKHHMETARKMFFEIVEKYETDRRFLAGRYKECKTVAKISFRSVYRNGLLNLPGIASDERFMCFINNGGNAKMAVVRILPAFKSTNEENEELRRKLLAAEARIKELEQAIPV